jgi:hypothetical protein
MCWSALSPQLGRKGRCLLQLSWILAVAVPKNSQESYFIGASSNLQLLRDCCLQVLPLPGGVWHMSAMGLHHDKAARGQPGVGGVAATGAKACNACLANPGRLVGSSSVQSLSHKHGRCVPAHGTVANTTTAGVQGCAAASGALSAACGLIGSWSMADWKHWHLCAMTHLCVHTWSPGAAAHTVTGMQRGADICSPAAAAVGRCDLHCVL